MDVTYQNLRSETARPRQEIAYRDESGDGEGRGGRREGEADREQEMSGRDTTCWTGRGRTIGEGDDMELGGRQRHNEAEMQRKEDPHRVFCVPAGSIPRRQQSHTRFRSCAHTPRERGAWRYLWLIHPSRRKKGARRQAESNRRGRRKIGRAHV